MSKATGLAAALAAAVGGSDASTQPKHFLSTGFPPLDHAISGKYFGGGMPSGRIVEMFGPPSAGKTAIATNTMISAQKMGGFALFNDHERSFHQGLGQGFGLSLDPNKWLFKAPRTFEESLTNSMKVALAIREGKFIDRDAPIAMVFDSLASMVPQSKLEKDLDKMNMHDSTALARATASSFPALALLAEEHNILLLFLNQMRTKIGVMFGDPTTTPGGQAPEFYASVRIRLGRRQIAVGKGEDKKITGQLIGAECVKNKINRPFGKASWRFMFQEDGSGKFDVTHSLIDYLVAAGRLAAGSKQGTVMWTNGKQYPPGMLSAKIDAEGLHGELNALLPDPSVVVAAPEPEEEEAAA